MNASDQAKPAPQQDPKEKAPKPPFGEQSQEIPGTEAQMNPKADHGEQSYRGSGRLAGKVALITGADSGIGKAVALAFAREGADVLVSYLNEQEDAQDTVRLVEEAGRNAAMLAGDISDEAHCRQLVQQAVQQFGRIDILVNNAAHQKTFQSLEEITSQEWDLTFRTNIYSMFHICKAAVPHMPPGSSIINTCSVEAYQPDAMLLPYATTKGAIVTFSKGLAQMLAPKGIRVNTVAPGPVWTPLIPATMPPEQVSTFGQDTPMQRPAQPAELAPVYVLLASQESSYVSGATIPVTGGTPLI